MDKEEIKDTLDSFVLRPGMIVVFTPARVLSMQESRCVRNNIKVVVDSIHVPNVGVMLVKPGDKVEVLKPKEADNET